MLDLHHPLSCIVALTKCHQVGICGIYGLQRTLHRCIDNGVEEDQFRDNGVEEDQFRG
jgi:hypothetical protein